MSIVIVDPAVLCEDQDRLWGEREVNGAAGPTIARIRPNRHLRNGGDSLRQTAGYLRKSGRILRDSRGQLAQLVVDRLQMSRSKLVRGQGRKRRVDFRIVLIEIGPLHLVAAKPLAELIILCVLTGHADSPIFLLFAGPPAKEMGMPALFPVSVHLSSLFFRQIGSIPHQQFRRVCVTALPGCLLRGLVLQQIDDIAAAQIVEPQI